MRFTLGYRRSRPGRTVTLVAGIAAVASAATVLGMQAAAPEVHIDGTPEASAGARTYDILVTAGTAAGLQAASAGRPGLDTPPGGISLAQYESIRRLNGVQVAAPMTMVGYVPLTVVIPVQVPSPALTPGQQVLTVSALKFTEGGVREAAEPNIGSTYLTPGACPAGSSGSQPEVISTAAPRTTTCWSTTDGPQRQTWTGPQPRAVSVPLAWTFLLPLVAVDPDAEARLLHLDTAVTQHDYLPEAAGPATGPVPVIMAASSDDGDVADVSMTRLPASAVAAYRADVADDPAVQSPALGTLLDSASGTTVATTTVTAATAYSDLRALLAARPASIPAYWTPAVRGTKTTAGGDLVPRSGSGALTPHIAVAVTTGDLRPSVGTALQVVGSFDPAKVASPPATPSPYAGERLPGADAQSRQLLAGRPLQPGDNPAAGYPLPGASLVMPLQDVASFTSAASYTRTDPGAPIGSIRVRVSGAAGDSPASIARVRAVAAGIVRATGLHVEATLAATPASRVVQLPAASPAAPALRVSETWYLSATRTVTGIGMDPRDLSLAVLLLVLGAAFVANAVRAELRIRRGDLVTLRALGWRRGQLTGLLIEEIALMAVIAGTAAALGACALAAVLGGRVAASWALLSMPVAVGMTLAAAWWPVRLGMADAEPDVAREQGLPHASRRSTHAVGQAVVNLCTAPGRTILGGCLLGAACSALGLELSLQWTLSRLPVFSWAGLQISPEPGPADIAAVAAVLVMAMAALTDIDVLAAGERAGELRTLRALGWPARGAARIASAQAVLLGLASGIAASTVTAAVTVAAARDFPVSVLAVAACVTGTAVVVSLAAAGLSALAVRAANGRAIRQSA